MATDGPTTEQTLDASADPTIHSVETIARIEGDALNQRSVAERFSDRITRFVGSMTFVTFHVVLFIFWAVINSGLVPGITPFDPFPYGILTLLVSAEGVFLAIFILISQNRMSRQADRRAQLGLQVSMLAEHEMTTMLRMQQRLSEHLGLRFDEIMPEAGKLMQETDVERLIEHLDEKLPEA